MTKSTSPNFSVIIPNFNGAKFIKPCLQALRRAISNCPHSKFEVILVDNGSTDQSLSIFKQYFGSQIISLDQNYGFAKAVNLGITHSRYEYICVLNNDLQIQSNWFSLLTPVITSNPSVATFCGTVLNHDGTKIESQGLKYFMSGRCENINNGHPFSPTALSGQSTIAPIWGSSAAVIIYQKHIIQKIGLFDESFFAYIEDVDLSYRLQKYNYQTLLTPSAISYHLGGATSSQMGSLRQYYTFRNWIRLIIKNYSLKEIILNFPGIVLERFRNLSYLIRSLLSVKMNQR